MVLAERQWQIRNLVMGPGTPFRVQAQTNPFTLNIRANQGGKRAWNHGSWSGAEWGDERVVPLRIFVEADDLTPATWLQLNQQLAAAFAPIGDVAVDVELRHALGGREYVMFGRPRMVEPSTRHIGSGFSFTQCAFVALDPHIYSGELLTAGPVGLAVFIGGLAVPYTVPHIVEHVRVGGQVDIFNDGTAETPLQLRIDGPIPGPQVIVQHADDTVESLRVGFDLIAGQFLEIDTGSRAVLLNGIANRRGQVSGDFPLLAGEETAQLRFLANGDDTGTLSVEWRSAWW